MSDDEITLGDIVAELQREGKISHEVRRHLGQLLHERTVERNALIAEVSRLRALVEAGYREGYEIGLFDGSAAGAIDPGRQWALSQTKQQLEAKP